MCSLDIVALRLASLDSSAESVLTPSLISDLGDISAATRSGAAARHPSARRGASGFEAQRGRRGPVFVRMHLSDVLFVFFRGELRVGAVGWC